MKNINLVEYTPRYSTRVGRRHIPTTAMITVFILFLNFIGYAQVNTTPFLISSEEDFSERLFNRKNNIIDLYLTDTEVIEGKVNFQEGTVDNYRIIGEVLNTEDGKLSSFNFVKENDVISGTIILKSEEKAYKYYIDDTANVYVEETSIHNVLCVSYELETETNAAETSNSSSVMQVPILESNPGAPGTIYLDFDGELVENTFWASGGDINALPTNYSDEKITNIWRIMVEDFKPFNFNITTNRTIFDAAPVNRRMMVIFTPTTDAAPGTGGVALLRSFASNTDEPCWAFNSQTRAAGETGSHEVGHTLGLDHDGHPAAGDYYRGHGEWSPIMGWSANRTLGHWSMGEYPGATNQEDDISIITENSNGVGYKVDDHGDIITAASLLITNADGTVNASQNTGLIERREDKDVYSFVTQGGQVTLEVQPDPYYPNLNIQARILNGLGEEMAISSPEIDLSAAISTNLAEGTYFIEIDGVGEGDLNSGYSDYSSIGEYSISGNYPLGDNNQPPISNFEATILCGEAVFVNTSINTVDTYLWDFGDGATSTEQSPTHNYAADGTYTVSLTTTNGVGTDTNVKNDFVVVATPSLPTAMNIDVCNGISTSVVLEGSNGYVWYDQETGGNLLGTGNAFHTPAITANTTYYVAGTLDEISVENVGIEEIDQSRGTIHGGGQYLIFDVEETTLLRRARVYAEESKERTLQLRSSTGTVLTSKTIFIEAGEHIIDINIELPIGENLQIGFPTGSDLFRNNQGVSYPYQVNDVVEIKRSSAPTNSQQFYYFLYNWEVSTLGGCKTETRTPITLNVVDAPSQPVITYNSNLDELTTSAGYQNYQWYHNGAVINGANTSSHIATETGRYTVSVYNGIPCEIFSEETIVGTLGIEELVANEKEIILYPNPVEEVLNIRGGNIVGNISEVKITNMLGQTVLNYTGESLEETYDTSSLNDGMYFFIIDNTVVKRFVKKGK